MKSALTFQTLFLLILGIVASAEVDNVNEMETLKQEVRELRDLYHGLSANIEVDDNNLKQKGILQRVKRAEGTSFRGRDGRDGAPGIAGDDGKDGRDGRDGIRGEKGMQGNPGVPGQREPAGTPGKPYGGAVYTRWGRTVCGPKSTLIYKGLAGNSRFDHTGGGTNYQCLPYNPEYNRYYSKNGGTGTWWSGYIAGTEYHSYSYGIFPNEAYNDNVPCAVCLADTRPSGVMIPAKRTCPIGWHKEYEGYLMSGYYNYNHQTTFECVDAQPEYVKGESGDTDGSRLFFTRPVCDKGIPCPSYYPERALTCVFCTK